MGGELEWHSGVPGRVRTLPLALELELDERDRLAHGGVRGTEEQQDGRRKAKQLGRVSPRTPRWCSALWAFTTRLEHF